MGNKIIYYIQGGDILSEIIKVENLRKIYYMGKEKVVALDNINLIIEKGEICCILGTSGSGKSTLLNMLAGLEKPTKGKITINKQDITSMNETKITRFRQKHVGFVFQSYNLLPNLTALENVAIPMVFGGMSKKKREAKAKNMLKMVGLGERLSHKPTQMSGGQQQRVSIARAFVSSPEIVFADEPTGNLDTKTTMEVLNLICTMAKEKKQTLIIVTHDPETCMFADKIIHIRDGLVESIEVKTNKEEVQV